MERVSTYCNILALHLGLEENVRKTLILAAFLHDLGKIEVDTDILITAKKLTDEQWEQLKKHPSDSAKMVREIGCSPEIADIVEHHHERLDGKGYPHHLKGAEINYLTRILTIADSFDAMTNNRPYNKKKTFDEGFKELRRCSNTQFDPQLVVQFIDAIKEATHFNSSEE